MLTLHDFRREEELNWEVMEQTDRVKRHQIRLREMSIQFAGLNDPRMIDAIYWTMDARVGKRLREAKARLRYAQHELGELKKRQAAGQSALTMPVPVHQTITSLPPGSLDVFKTNHPDHDIHIAQTSDRQIPSATNGPAQQAASTVTLDDGQAAELADDEFDDDSDDDIDADCCDAKTGTVRHNDDEHDPIAVWNVVSVSEPREVTQRQTDCAAPSVAASQLAQPRRLDVALRATRSKQPWWNQQPTDSGMEHDEPWTGTVGPSSLDEAARWLFRALVDAARSEGGVSHKLRRVRPMLVSPQQHDEQSEPGQASWDQPAVRPPSWEHRFADWDEPTMVCELAADGPWQGSFSASGSISRADWISVEQLSGGRFAGALGRTEQESSWAEAPQQGNGSTKPSSL